MSAAHQEGMFSLEGTGKWREYALGLDEEHSCKCKEMAVFENEERKGDHKAGTGVGMAASQ